MSETLTIAIDGPSASGKGTLARNLAESLGLAYLDTGTLYRATGKKALESGGNPDEERVALAAAEKLADSFRLEDLQDPDLRSEPVAQASSQVAVFSGVRATLTRLMQSFAAHPPPGTKGAVLDGREIGTVVCPDADIKFFVTADTEVRAQRRFKELQSKGIDVTYEAVLTDMRRRDARDSERAADPLRPAGDAIIIDTSALKAADVLQTALDHVRKRLSMPAR